MSHGADEAAGAEPFAGDGRFRPVAFLGRGSMGSVHRVHDAELGLDVALKSIPPGDAEPVYRLKREFRSLAGVVHPNLIQLHDLVVRDDACYFTMEYVEGPDFVEHVRGGAGEPEREGLLRRFGEAAPQLVRGVMALHAAGRLHRDLKPPNVRVDPAGRVVILDFDLAAPLDALDEPGAGAVLAGTVAYMPPEQLWGLGVSEASDWYAVGVVLHEALTGRLPFDRPQDLPGPGAGEIRLEAWDPSLPAPLRALVAALLDPDPERRPGGEALLEALGAAPVPAPATRPRAAGAAGDPFVGRDRELAELERAVRDGTGVRIRGIHGPSGIGKTELVRRLLQRNRDGALILAGRCHPQESVPYKALDPIVDGLSSHLLALDPAERAALLPDGMASLARLFPVLSRVGGADGGEAGLDPTEARRRGLGALRELLRRVARQRTLVLWIDDAQWSDADSAALLGELLRPPAPPPLALLLSYRSQDRGGVPLLRILGELAEQFSSLSMAELALQPLEAGETLELARRLCPAELAGRADLEALAAEAGGSPFFVSEIVWHLRTQGSLPTPGAVGALALDRVIATRLGELPDDERRLLELVSLCGRPTERGLLLAAARLGERGRPVVGRLEGLGLVRTAPLGDESSVEAYHDRIREGVAGALPEPLRTERHRELAVTFEASGRAEPDVLAHHFHGAGNLPRASDHALAAADRAAEALAFVRAAELYRSAREWDPRDPQRERMLLAREGDALVKGAHLVEGGRVLLRAARTAPRLEGLELRRRAAEHLVFGGDVDAAFAELDALLRDLGLRFPRTPARAFAAAVARLGEVAARRLAPHRPPAPVDEAERIRIDFCYGLGLGLLSVDSARGIYFSILSLVRALRAGDPGRSARSLSAVGGSFAVVGGPLATLGRRMMRRAEALAEAVGSPELTGTLEVGRAQVLMLDGRCREALSWCDAGVQRLAEECQGHAFECNIGRATALRALEELGRLGEMEARAGELRDAAVAVGDRHAEIRASQHLAIARIAVGDGAGARELARQGLEQWTRRDFHMQHLYAVRIQCLCDLHEGRARDGLERLDEIDAPLRGSGLLRIPLVRTDVSALRGQLALAAAAGDPPAAEAALRTCARAARRLERESRADARLHANLLAAGMAALRGDAAQAEARLDAAIREGEAGDLALRAACARLRRAGLRGDAEDARRARADMAACGVDDADGWAAVCAPGFPPARGPAA